MNEIKPHPAIVLDYDSKPRKRWRRRLIKLSLVLIIGAFAWTAWKWGPTEWQRTRVLYWQDQCLTYTAPADQVVCEEEPKEMTALLAAHPGEYVDFWSQPIPPTLRLELTRSEIVSLKPVAVVRFAPCWAKLASIIGTHYMPGAPSAFFRGATVFLHERFTPKGERRLVVVQYLPVDDEDFDFHSGYDIEYVVIIPGTLFRNPEDITENEGLAISRGTVDPQPQIRIFAGQADPLDATHFTVRYEAWGQTDTLDGRLDDDGHITLTPRHKAVPP